MKAFRYQPIRGKFASLFVLTSTIALLLTSAAFITYQWIVESNLVAMQHRHLLGAGMGILVLLIASAVAFAVACRLQKWITTPLQEMAAMAQASTAQGDYSMRVARAGNDELGALTDAFNRMLDETQRRSAELGRRVAEGEAELAHANKELEAFTYSVSHDLRAPLRHIAGYAELVRDDADTQLSEDAKSGMARITRATEKLGALIESLLQLSRVGRRPLVKQVMKLDALVDGALRELEAEIHGRRIEWQRQPLPALNCDPALMGVVFVNLLSNALKYTRTRETAIIALGSRIENGRTEVFIRDNGVGFDPRLASKLFGVFERLHTAAAFEGGGVGLAMADRIIRKHGGQITAEGQVEGGATFHFWLPGM